MIAPLFLPESPRRILIIKPSAIGDIVHALPVLSLVRRRWPTAHLAWVATPACAGLVERHPMINEVIPFERKQFANAFRNPRAALSLMRFVRRVRRGSFDMAIDLQGLFRSGWLARQSGARVRLGPSNARELAWVFYTHHVPTSWEDHAVDRYLGMAEMLGCGRGPIDFTFAVDDADHKFVDALLPAVPFAALLPGANWDTKRWNAKKFAALVEPLQQRFGLTSVVAGGPGDTPLAAQIHGALDLTGRTNLRQLVALLSRATLVIAADTGPMHIAAALGKPLVTMYGPTNPTRTGPYGRASSVVQLDIPCSPCYSRKCTHISCLEWLGIETVLKLAEEQLRDADVSPNRALRLELPVVK